MELTLMCQDREVATFELNLASKQVTKVQPGADAARAPLGVHLDGPSADADMTRFVWRRSISPRRSDLGNILAATGAVGPAELAVRARGLSLSDPFWYRTEGERASWSELNFFANGWDPAFGEALLSRDGDALALASCMVPDLTSSGLAPKAWVQTPGGPRLLKAAIGLLEADPIGEVAASRMLARILPAGEFLPYDLEERDGRVFSSSPLIAGPDEELAPASTLIAEEPLPQDKLDATWSGKNLVAYARALESLGIADARRIASQIAVCGTLLMQADLHLGNYGIIRNVRTGTLRAAPIFDLGGTFNTAISGPTAHAVMTRPKMAMAVIRRKFRGLGGGLDYSWFDPKALDGFDRELEEILLYGGLLPRAYVGIVVDAYRLQLAYVADRARE